MMCCAQSLCSFVHRAVLELRHKVAGDGINHYPFLSFRIYHIIPSGCYIIKSSSRTQRGKLGRCSSVGTNITLKRQDSTICACFIISQPCTITIIAHEGISILYHAANHGVVWVESYYRSMESKVYASSANDTTWRQWLDYPSFARYFLTNEVCGNPDMIWSCYMYKKRNDQKAYTGPVWDFDIAFDNDYRIYPEANHTSFIFAGASNAESFARHIVYADQRTRDEMTEYWHQGRNKGISVEEMTEFVNQTAEYLDASQRLNFIRWPILSQKVHMNPVALGSYNAEVQRLKEFLRMRIGWMDSKLGYTWHPIEDMSDIRYQQTEIRCQKIIRGGQLLIIRDGWTYTVTGEELSIDNR